VSVFPNPPSYLSGKNVRMRELCACFRDLLRPQDSQPGFSLESWGFIVSKCRSFLCWLLRFFSKLFYTVPTIVCDHCSKTCNLPHFEIRRDWLLLGRVRLWVLDNRQLSSCYDFCYNSFVTCHLSPKKEDIHEMLRDRDASLSIFCCAFFPWKSPPRLLSLWTTSLAFRPPRYVCSQCFLKPLEWLSV